ncbi:sodium:proton antiporter, partial [bacterium]|nr:sodium:proton antiporter [bacterium]
MSTFISLCKNPALISVILLCFLCLRRVNVLLAIIVSTITAGLLSGMNIKVIMDTFISGMGGNSETALSYILLGAFAATMAHTGFTDVISSKIANIVTDKKGILLLLLCLIAMASQNIIPIHIAFIPILIPPLLPLMNRMQLDRRAVACVLAFGLKMPYIALPVGFGLIFQNLIADNMAQNGVQILRGDVWKYTAILGLGMFIGLMVALFVTYRNKREYKDINIGSTTDIKETKFRKEHVLIVVAALATFVVQLLTKSLPLGALVGLGIMFSCKVIPNHKMDSMMNEGIYLMGYVAFVMLVAAGFADVLTNTGAIEKMVNSILPVLPSNIFLT